MAYSAYTLSQVFGDPPQTNGSVCPDPGLLIVGGSGQKLQQFSIDCPVIKFDDHSQHSLDRLLSNDWCDIGKSGSLQS